MENSPNADKAIITEAAQKYGVDPKILWGLYGTETSFGKNLSTSSAGAEGPFQFEPATARSMGVNPHDFKSSAFGAAKYLSQYKGRGVGGMLSAYNAGPGGGYQQDYVTKTLQNAKSYGAGAERPVSSTETGSQPAQAAPKAQGAQPPIFNEQGFQKAQRTASSNRLLTSLPGGQELRGLLSTKGPTRSEYETPGAAAAEGKAPAAPSAPAAAPQGAGGALNGFLPKGASYTTMRTDKGKDFQLKPGEPLLATGHYEVVDVPSDPSGFGPAYPVVRFTSGPDTGRTIYLGHTDSAVRSGQRGNPGDVLAHTSRTGHNAPPGWVEIGLWGPRGPAGKGSGETQAGQEIARLLGAR